MHADPDLFDEERPHFAQSLRGGDLALAWLRVVELDHELEPPLPRGCLDPDPVEA